MTIMPNPRTWIDREIPPYSTVNAEVYGTLAWLLQPPMCKVRQTVAQSIPNASFTALTFTVEDFDPYNWHSSTTNTTRITPTFPGWYRGWYGIGFSTATGGLYRAGYLRQNGSTPARSRRDHMPTTVGQMEVTRGIPFFLRFNGTTDYAEVMAYQDTGSAMLTSVVNPMHQAEFFLRWWAPL
jgi:hypothetical protein